MSTTFMYYKCTANACRTTHKHTPTPTHTNTQKSLSFPLSAPTRYVELMHVHHSSYIDRSYQCLNAPFDIWAHVSRSCLRGRMLVALRGNNDVGDVVLLVMRPSGKQEELCLA